MQMFEVSPISSQTSAQPSTPLVSDVLLQIRPHSNLTAKDHILVKKAVYKYKSVEAKEVVREFFDKD